MQFALLIYHSPEEFAMRKNDYSDPHLGAWRAYYKALVEAGVYVGGDALEVPETGTTVRLKEGKRRVQDGPYADTKEQLAGFIILELPSLTPPSNGLRAAREHRSAQLKSGRWRLKPCAGGSQDEWKQSGGRSPDHRAGGPRVLRPSGGLSFLAHARRGQR